MKKNFTKNHSPSSKPQTPLLKLPKITIRLADREAKLNLQKKSQKMSIFSHHKFNTKSIYDLPKGKTTFDYEFQDRVRMQKREIKRKKNVQTKSNKENGGKSLKEKCNKNGIKQIKRESKHSTQQVIQQLKIERGKREEESLFNKIQNFLMDPKKMAKNYSQTKLKKEIEKRKREYREKYKEELHHSHNAMTISESIWRRPNIKSKKFSIIKSDFSNEADALIQLTQKNEKSIKNYISILFEKGIIERIRFEEGKGKKKGSGIN